MEWIETRGKSVDDAKDRALDMLGVTADEADFEVMTEAKTGLFGRVKEEARVRARVRPREPRPKTERRGRRRSGDRARSGGSKGGGSRSGSKGGQQRSSAKSGSSGGKSGGGSSTRQRNDGRSSQKSGKSGSRGGGQQRKKKTTTDASARNGGDRPTKGGDESSRASAGRPKTDTKQEKESTVSEAINATQQAEMVSEFLTGLVAAFQVGGEVTSEQVDDDDTVIVHVDGGDLGLLIGPKGNTLRAIEELGRTVVQRQADGPIEGRVKVDAGRYRERRQEALEAFVGKVATEVADAGVEKALEPMSAADRKIVHDAVQDIDGVRTISEGEEPRRRVVLVPDS